MQEACEKGKTMNRDSMVFYRSFMEATDNLEAEQYKKTISMILHYALDGDVPELDSSLASSMFILMKPQIDANNRRFENGCKGGRPKKNQEETKVKPKQNQEETKQKPNDNVNDNVNDNDNVNVNINYKQITDMFHSLCPSYPTIKTLSEARKKAIKARMNQYSIDDFKLLFEKAEASTFLKGGNNNNWSANFDWLIKDANMAKVLDGNYDNRKERGTNNGQFENLPQYGTFI